MLQISSTYYYLTVQKKLEILGTDTVLLLPPENSVKKSNLNSSNIYSTCK